MNKIEIQNLNTHYGKFHALKNVNITLEKGKIYGLLGRNGAGKSTLLRTITNRVHKSSGQILYDGKESLSEIEAGRVYLTEPDNLLPQYMKPKDLLTLAKRFYPNFSLDGALADASEYGLSVNKPYKNLSTGYQSIFRSILALHTHADFILLDEPTLGHDVISRELFYKKVLAEFAKEENTILLSSHLIDELSPLVEEVLIIENGSLVLQENAEDLRSRYVRLSGPGNIISEMTQGKTYLKKEEKSGFTSLILEGKKEEYTPDPSMGLEVKRPDLQELFIALATEKLSMRKEPNHEL